MINIIRKWATTFEESWIPMLEVLSGADDPHGEYLQALDGRIRQLEAEMAALTSKSAPMPADTGQGE